MANMIISLKIHGFFMAIEIGIARNIARFLGNIRFNCFPVTTKP